MKELIKDEGYIKRLEMIIETSFDGFYITDGKANTIVINKAEVVEVLSINAVTANGNSIDDKEYQEFKDYYTTVLEDLAK